MDPDLEDIGPMKTQSEKDLESMCDSLRRVIKSRGSDAELKGFDERYENFQNRNNVLRDIAPCKTE